MASEKVQNSRIHAVEVSTEWVDVFCNDMFSELSIHKSVF